MKVNTTSQLKQEELIAAINEQLTDRQKVNIVKRMSEFGLTIDMSYVEDALVALSRICLKRIKKDKALYNRNRAYFKALKTIVQVKEAN